MILPAQPPHDVGAEVAHTEADHTESLPLPDVHKFVTQEVRRRFAPSNDHQRADGDAVGALRYRATLPQAEALSMFDRHSRNCSPDLSTDAPLAACGKPPRARRRAPSAPTGRRTAAEHHRRS